MDYGAHLPVIGFGSTQFSLERLLAYVKTANELGFKAISVNDHLISARPWLDAPTALAAALTYSASMTVGTSVVLPVPRGVVQVAKALAAIDILSGGRLIIGVGPGSSARDYEIVGVDYGERWKRFDEAVRVLRLLLSDDGGRFVGRFYSSEPIELDPKPLQKPHPPIWIGSWGSDAGLRRVARLGDGWLASAYNTTPEQFAAGLEKLRANLETCGKDPRSFPNALVTMFMYVTDARAKAESILSETLAPMLHRPIEQLRERLLVGSPETCAEKLAGYRAAGLQRLFVWPVADELDQLAVFQRKVAPLIEP
ncbi:MAG TPA: LLM class flavin-dependent oxidoreductase [Candidatus Acidoferrales bacterium]|nr:LLM class flavin-dependent oxidoreductase [Candidatus Acidoferrales bacterium]